MSSLNVATHRAYAKLISLKMEHKLCLIANSKLTGDYVSRYADYLNSFNAKLDIFTDDAMDPNLIDKYITKHNTYLFMQNQLAYLQQAIEDNQRKIAEQSEQLKNHQLVINALHAAYEEVELVFMSLREDVQTLEIIEQKISHSVSYIKYLVQDVWPQKRGAKVDCTATLIDFTLAEGSVSRWNDSSTLSSFNSSSSCGSDQVLCSTKLDCCESCPTIMAMQQQQQRSKRNYLAQYVAEVAALVNMPIVNETIMSAEKYFLSLLVLLYKT